MQADARIPMKSDESDDSDHAVFTFSIRGILDYLPKIPFESKHLLRQDRFSRFLFHIQVISVITSVMLCATGIILLVFRVDDSQTAKYWVMWGFSFGPLAIAFVLSWTIESFRVIVSALIIGLLSSLTSGIALCFHAEGHILDSPMAVIYFFVVSAGFYNLSRLAFRISIILGWVVFVCYVTIGASGEYYSDPKRFTLVVILFFAAHVFCTLVAFQVEKQLRQSFLWHQRSVKVIKDWRYTDRTILSKKVTVDPPVQDILASISRICNCAALTPNQKESLYGVMKLLRSSPQLFRPVAIAPRDRFQALMNPEARSLIQSLVGIECNDVVACVVSDPTGPPLNHAAPDSTRSERWKNSRYSTIFPEIPDLTDERFSEMIAKMYEEEGWNINLIGLAGELNDRPLYYTTMFVLERMNIFEKLGVDAVRMKNFLASLERRYQRNPYHNAIHATDVLLSLYYWTQFLNREHFDAIDLYSLVIAAIVHDVDHDGRTNMFHVASESPRALLHNDRSVQENHHLAVAFELMSHRDKDILRSFSTSQKRRIREQVIDLVLATDMSIHFQVLAMFKTKVTNEEIDISSKDDRLLTMKMLMKSSDIGHVSKRLDIHMNWTNLLVDEFYLQGDEEKKSQLPVSTYMDREKPMVERSQVGFMDVIALPLLQVVTEALIQTGSVAKESESPSNPPDTIRVPHQHAQSNREEWFRRMTSSG